VFSRISEQQDSVASGAWVHAPPKKSSSMGDPKQFLPSSFLAGGDVQNNQKTQPIGLFSPDRSQIFPLFRSVNLYLLSCFRLAVPSSCW